MKETHDFSKRGERLRAAREAARLNVPGLAAELEGRGVEETSTATISRIENDQKVPALEYVEALSELSGYSLDWLVFGVGNRGSAVDVIRRLQKELGVVEGEYVTFYAPPPTTPSAPSDSESERREQGRAVEAGQQEEDPPRAPKAVAAGEGHGRGGRRDAAAKGDPGTSRRAKKPKNPPA